MTRILAAGLAATLVVAAVYMHTTEDGAELRDAVHDSVESVATQGVDWNAVDAAMGRASVAQPGDVRRFNFPRGDLKVIAAGVEVKPALALGGWVAMKAIPGGAMAMGDLVLTDDEVAPVLSRLQAGGVEQTAIHHHLLHESPRTYYVHINAKGHPLKIAETVRAAVALTKAPAPSPAG